MLTEMRASTDEHHLSTETIISSLTIITTTTSSLTRRTLTQTTSQSPSSANPHIEEQSSSSHSLPLAIRHQHRSSNVPAICRAAGCSLMTLRRKVSERRSNLFREECSVHTRSFCPNVHLFCAEVSRCFRRVSTRHPRLRFSEPDGLGNVSRMLHFCYQRVASSMNR